MFLDSSLIRGRFLHTSNKIAQFNFILFLFLLHMSFRLPVNNKLLFIIRTLQLLLSITSFRKHSLKWVFWQVSVNHITLNDTDLSKCKTTFKLFKFICIFFNISPLNVSVSNKICYYCYSSSYHTNYIVSCRLNACSWNEKTPTLQWFAVD